MKGQYILSSERPGRAVVKLALPAILSALISIIYNMTDTYFIGLLRDTSQLTAISIAMPIMWLIPALGNIISAGSPQVISLFSGSGDREGASKCRSFCVFGTLALSLIVTPVTLPLIKPLLSIMGEGTALEYAREYLLIVLAATPLVCVGNAAMGVLRSDGRTFEAGLGSAIGIIVNIALDPLFILALDMGITGAALATALSAAASMIYSLIAVRHDISIKNALPGIKTVKKVLSLSLTSTCQSVITAVMVMYSLGMTSGYGGGVVASISVSSKLYSIVVSVVSALSFSLQPYIGYNFAAGNTERLKKGIKISACAGTVICLIGSAAFLLLGRPFMTLFTDDPEVVSAGAEMLKCLAAGAPVISLQMTCLSYLSSTGRAMRSLAAGLARQILIFVPVMLIMRTLFGFTGLMLSYPVTDILSTILAALLCLGAPAKQPVPEAAQ